MTLRDTGEFGLVKNEGVSKGQLPNKKTSSRAVKNEKSRLMTFETAFLFVSAEPIITYS